MNSILDRTERLVPHDRVTDHIVCMWYDITTQRLMFLLHDTGLTLSYHCEAEYAAHLTARLGKHMKCTFMFLYDRRTEGTMVDPPHHLAEAESCVVS